MTSLKKISCSVKQSWVLDQILTKSFCLWYLWKRKCLFRSAPKTGHKSHVSSHTAVWRACALTGWCSGVIVSNTIRQDKLHYIVQNSLGAESVELQPISTQPFSAGPESLYWARNNWSVGLFIPAMILKSALPIYWLGFKAASVKPGRTRVWDRAVSTAGVWQGWSSSLSHSPHQIWSCGRFYCAMAHIRCVSWDGSWVSHLPGVDWGSDSPSHCWVACQLWLSLTSYVCRWLLSWVTSKVVNLHRAVFPPLIVGLQAMVNSEDKHPVWFSVVI